MTTQYITKIIHELKHYKSQELSICDFVYLLNCIINSQCSFYAYVKKFIQNNYSHDQIAWKEIQDEVLLQMYNDSLKFIRENAQSLKTEEQNKQKQLLEYVEEKSIIKKTLKQKNIPKEKLIDDYLEQIRRTKTLLSKISSSEQSQNSKPNKSSLQVIERQKYEQNIKLLQNRINIMKDNEKFNVQNDGLLLGYKNKFKNREDELKKISDQFQFKKKYFLELETNLSKEKQSVLQNQIKQKRKLCKQRLKQLFLHYSSQNFEPNAAFDKMQTKLQHIDLRIYLKYFKELKEANKDNQTVINDKKSENNLKQTNLTLLFRKNGNNNKEINFNQFLSIHDELFLGTNKKGQNYSQTQKQQMESQISKRSLNQIESQLENLTEKMTLFYNPNIDRILNINSKNSLLQNKTRTISRKSRQSQQKQRDQPPKTKTREMQKIIDKSLDDYQSTKRQIHESFLKRSKKQKLEHFEQKLKMPQHIKIVINKNGKNDFAKSNPSQKRFDRKIFHKKTPEKVFQSNEDKQKQSAKSLHFNKDIFQDIIREVPEQAQYDHNELAIQKKSKSLGNILFLEDRKDKKSLTKRSQSGKQITHQFKSTFTLPKITRISQQKFGNQSITKTLDYLYKKIGQKQQPKIKKILQLDNAQYKRVHAVQNQYLQQYFTKQSTSQKQSLTQEVNSKRQKSKAINLNCRKYRQENYEKFMKF